MTLLAVIPINPVALSRTSWTAMRRIHHLHVGGCCTSHTLHMVVFADLTVGWVNRPPQNFMCGLCDVESKPSPWPAGFLRLRDTLPISHSRAVDFEVVGRLAASTWSIIAWTVRALAFETWPGDLVDCGGVWSISVSNIVLATRSRHWWSYHLQPFVWPAKETDEVVVSAVSAVGLNTR